MGIAPWGLVRARGVVVVASLGLVVTFAPACNVGTTYRISHDELERLAQVAPSQRWQAVAVSQTPTQEDTDLSFDVSLAHVGNYGNHCNTDSQCPAGACSGQHVCTDSVGVFAMNAFLGLTAVVGAVTVLPVVFAIREGRRFDGWMAVSPDEPMVLAIEGRDALSVPLSRLTPDLAAVAESALIDEGAVERFVRRGRAPLDRQGWGLIAGPYVVDLPRPRGATAFAAGGRAEVDYSLSWRLGLGLGLDLASNGGDATLGSLGLEAKVYPLRWLGVYADGAIGLRGDATSAPDHTQGALIARFGLLGELPLTSRMSLELRTGAEYLWGFLDGTPPWTVDASIGLATF
jgi:hypothetical protein